MGCAKVAGAQMQRVLSASSQVVSGVVYRIRAQTSEGVLRLRVYEQTWTKTLAISEATLDCGHGELPVVGANDQEVRLDADAFAAFARDMPPTIMDPARPSDTDVEVAEEIIVVDNVTRAHGTFSSILLLLSLAVLGVVVGTLALTAHRAYRNRHELARLTSTSSQAEIEGKQEADLRPVKL